MNKIKANHLVFTKIQRNAFKYLFDKGIIFTIEQGKYIYQKKRPCKNNIYFVLSGEVEYVRAGDGERFGERVCLGFTIGEEVLFEKPALKNRIESVVATTNVCLLQIDANDFMNMAKRPSDGGGSTAYREDKKMLMDLLTQFYYIKTLWRLDAGLVDIPPMMEPWMRQ